MDHIAPTGQDIADAIGYRASTPEAPYLRSATGMAASSLPTGSAMNALRRMAAGAVGGLASEAAGQATEGTPSEPLARIGAAIVAPKAVPGLSGPALRKITADQLKQSADSGYDAFRSSGLQLDPSAAAAYANRTASELNSVGLSPRVSPQVHAALDELRSPVARRAVWDASGIQALRSELGQFAKQTQDFKATPQAAAATIALKNLDKHLDTLDPSLIRAGDLQSALNTLRDANSDYGAYRRVAALDRREMAADLRSAGEHSGMGYGNKLRQQMTNMALGPNRGFNDAEEAAINRVIYGTKTGNALRTVSNMLGGGGGLGGHGLGIMASIATGSPLPMAAPFAGMALRSLANRSTLRQFDQLQRSTALRSALGRQVLASQPPRVVDSVYGPALRALLAGAGQ